MMKSRMFHESTWSLPTEAIFGHDIKVGLRHEVRKRWRMVSQLEMEEDLEQLL